MKRILLALIALLLALPLRAEESLLGGLRKRVKVHSLGNGLRVLVFERHNAPLVSYQMMFRAGGVDEAFGKSGLAHLFEHMMFKGTRTVGTRDYEKEKDLIRRIDEAARQLIREEAQGERADAEKVRALRAAIQQWELEEQKLIVPSEFDEIYQREGAEGLNAFTSKDMTGFVVSLPSNKWELWPLLEADRMAHPVLREFYKEKEVVKEERRMRYESAPQGKLWENLLAIAFRAHPYGQPTIGWMSDLEFLTQADAEDFFRTHYAPNNAVVAMVGDVRAEEVFPKLERYFAQVSSQPVPWHHVTAEPEQDGERRVAVQFDAEPTLLIAFHKPNYPHPDNVVLDVIEEVLERGRTSRFYRELIEKQIALNAWASNGNPGERYPNLIVFGGDPRKPRTNADLERAILNELERLKMDLVSERDLKKIQNQIEADFIRNLASNSGMAYQLAYYDAILGGWEGLFDYLDRVRRVTPEDVRRAARKYFIKSNRTVATLERAPATSGGSR